MWITSEVEIQDELFDHLEQGQLVLFVGAGVSMKGTSNLPNFDDLVDEIADALYVEKRETTEPHDYYLGKVAKTKDVHQAARELVDVKNSKPNPLHYAIPRLFANDADVRIVTTNFDQHFTTVIREMNRDSNIYYAPALPTGRGFKGLAYIHGNIEQEKESLILTDGDFGRAYLTEGWARRFLVDLFSNYTVLFIGYSHNDPVMKYLATGLPPSTRRFAFVSQGDNTYHWEHLGIKPIVYPNKSNNHQSLVKAVKRWAELMGDNYITKRMRIRDIVTVPPSVEQEQLSYIKQSVKKIETLRYFIEFAQDYEWVEWLEAEGKLQHLFGTSAMHCEGDELLAEWIVQQFLFSHQEELFQLIYKNQSKLSPLLWRTICVYLNETKVFIEPLLFAKWTLLLLETADRTRSSIELVSHLLHKCSFPEHKEISLLILTFILDGNMKLKRVRRWEKDMQDSIELEETSRFSAEVFSHVQQLWDEKMKPHLSYFANPIMILGLEKIQTLSLRQGALQKKDGVLYDAAENLEHDLQPKNFTLLIRMVRDCLAYVCENNEQQASYYIGQLIESNRILQKRMAIEAMNKNVFVAVNEKIKWLLQHKLLLHSVLQHEVFQFLKIHFPFALEETKQEVVQIAVDQLDKEKSFEACHVIDWLYTCDSKSIYTARAYQAMKQKYPHFSSKRFSAQQEEAVVQSITCNVTANGLLRLKDEEMKRQIMLFSHEGIFEQRHFLEMLSKACKRDVEWSISLAYQLIREDKVSKEVWFVCIREWRNNRKLTNQQIQKIIPILQRFVRNKAYQWLISSFLYEIGNRLEELQEDSIRIVKRFAFSVFPQVMRSDVYKEIVGHDFYNASIQHPIGKMTSVLLKLLAYDHLYDRNIYEYLFLFEEHMRISSQRKNVMVARLTADVTFLYHIEKQWCRKHLLPYFDLKKQEEVMKYAWAGLCHTQINLPLFTEIKRFIKYVTEHLQVLHSHTKEGFLKWLSIVVIKCILYWDQRLDWLYPLFIQEKENDKIKFMEQLCYYVKTLSAREQQKFWESWLADFLIERPKMSVVTGREYVMFVRFVLCMDEMTERGLQSILTYFQTPSEQYDKEETKQLLLTILEKKESGKCYAKSYAEVFFVLLQNMQDASSFEKEVVQMKQWLTENNVDDHLLVAIQNEMIRIGIVIPNVKMGQEEKNPIFKK